MSRCYQNDWHLCSASRRMDLGRCRGDATITGHCGVLEAAFTHLHSRQRCTEFLL
ncbi:hypothetical protein DM02DRAFT_320109 [Periconia macrospinosa]|uniref:Uncharacterized protein n=1 Tax=Periconia macrospinosa TaxID=97972 RepID=A0A2V1D132_9PLEO|nr:hypothetical protein DM02DRAFT_320109 [Periconia macrospinosa]